MNRTYVTLSAFVLLSIAVAGSTFLLATSAQAHCQVPCGIYDDAARVKHLREDATTIEKAIQAIIDLSGKTDPQSFNQLIRWTTTKEDHASNVISVVSEYFLAQKIKPVAAGADGYDDYLKNLADHHAVMVAAMKTKQNADPQVVKDLNSAIDGLAAHYK